jgi:hypothetical protein
MKLYHGISALVVISVLLYACVSSQERGQAGPDEINPDGDTAIRTLDPGSALPDPLCPDPQPPLINDFEVHQPQEIAEPIPRSPYRDPVFGSCAVRVTDRKDDFREQRESQGIKNEYARVGSFNADGRLILLYGTAGEWFLYDAAALSPLAELPLGVEPRWDASDPALLYYLDETILYSTNIATGSTEVLRDFAADLPGESLAAVWTRYEGRPSRDSRYWGLMAEDEDWETLAFLIYDRIAGTVALRDVSRLPGIEHGIDHVTISPLGKYFLASYDHSCEQGSLGDDAHPCGLMVYDRDLSNGRGLLRTIGHYDAALDAAGKEVIVFQDLDNDWISMLDIATGEVTPLLEIDFSHSPIGFHFSGLAYEKPGWVLVSTYNGGFPEARTWMDDQIFAVELEVGGLVIRLAHTYSLVNEDMEHDYWAEPHASVNQDFSRILFTTNWGRSGTEFVETFLIELPHGWSLRD